jgi:hypothetical protein
MKHPPVGPLAVAGATLLARGQASIHSVTSKSDCTLRQNAPRLAAWSAAVSTAQPAKSCCHAFMESFDGEQTAASIASFATNSAHAHHLH